MGGSKKIVSLESRQCITRAPPRAADGAMCRPPGRQFRRLRSRAAPAPCATYSPATVMRSMSTEPVR